MNSPNDQHWRYVLHERVYSGQYISSKGGERSRSGNTTTTMPSCVGTLYCVLKKLNSLLRFHDTRKLWIHTKPPTTLTYNTTRRSRITLFRGGGGRGGKGEGLLNHARKSQQINVFNQVASYLSYSRSVHKAMPPWSYS